MKNEEHPDQETVSALMDSMFEKAKSLGPENVIINMEAFAAEITNAATVTALLMGEPSQEKIDATVFIAWTTIMLAIVEEVMERTENEEDPFFCPEKLTFRMRKRK